MKTAFIAATLIALTIFGVQARGEEQPSSMPDGARLPSKPGSGDWTKPIGLDRAPMPAHELEHGPGEYSQGFGEPEIDVVDAHWMALTMWGEARSHGEMGMRAVGHVIQNRRLAGGKYGSYVTDTVSQAYQFSCWNEGDPNRAVLMNISALAKDSRDYAMWVAARRMADEIMAGESTDITDGALFYHTIAVAPAWSRGIDPIRQIGNHVFFRNAG